MLYKKILLICILVVVDVVVFNNFLLSVASADTMTVFNKVFILFILILVQQLLAVNAAASFPHIKKASNANKHLDPLNNGQVQEHQQKSQKQQQQQQQQHQMSNIQYLQDKEYQQANSESEEDYNEPYQLVNDFKEDSSQPPYYPWNPYGSTVNAIPPAPPANVHYQSYPFDQLASIPSPRLLPIFGFTQPLFVPFYIPSEMLFNNAQETSNNIQNFEDVVLPRAAHGRRPGNSGVHRNSPIYYVRLPPTPYMFLPSFVPPPSPPDVGAYTPFLSLQSIPAISPLSAIYNIPLNFLANGKPSNIYQVGGSPSDLQGPYPYRPVQSFQSSNPFRPSNHHHNNNFMSNNQSPTQHHRQDSKLTLLKRPFIFNGRPDDIYILPNNLNHIYSDSSFY